MVAIDRSQTTSLAGTTLAQESERVRGVEARGWNTDDVVGRWTSHHGEEGSGLQKKEL